MLSDRYLIETYLVGISLALGVEVVDSSRSKLEVLFASQLSRSGVLLFNCEITWLGVRSFSWASALLLD